MSDRTRTCHRPANPSESQGKNPGSEARAHAAPNARPAESLIAWLEWHATQGYEPYIEFDSAGPWWLVRIGLGGTTVSYPGDTLSAAISAGIDAHEEQSGAAWAPGEDR